MTTITMDTDTTTSATGGPRIAVLSTSASQQSVSRQLLGLVAAALTVRGASTTLIDVCDLPAVQAGCGPYPAEYEALVEELATADGVVIGHGIHGYSVPGVTKNFIDVVGSAFGGKPVAFATAAGSMRSHLAVAALATSLVMESGAIWFPTTLQVTSDTIELAETLERVDELADLFVAFVRRLAVIG